MKKRLISVFAFALAVSAGAAFVLYQLISSKVKASVPQAPPTTKVWVASRDLELGALIQEKDVRTTEYLTPPAGALTKKEDIIGRGVSSAIHQDSPFFEAALAPKGAGAGFASTIPKGMRAFAVHVNEVVGVAGFAVAGMRVDVLVSGSAPGAMAENAGQVTRTLLQNIEVLSAGQNFQKDAEGKPVLVQVVNLLVTPEQAELMNLAADNRIQLVLRNPADRDIVETPGASTAWLFGGQPIRVPAMGARTIATAVGGSRAMPVAKGAAAPRAPRPAPVEPEKPRIVTVEVFAGDKRSESTFKDPGSSDPRPSPAGSSRGQAQ
jgi:pilus assembly protein CpaB